MFISIYINCSACFDACIYMFSELHSCKLHHLTEHFVRTLHADIRKKYANVPNYFYNCVEVNTKYVGLLVDYTAYKCFKKFADM